jgi:hypothetical protein
MTSPTHIEDSGAGRRMLMIETHSPWESGDVRDFLALATDMLAAGTPVRLHLIQNGVIWLRGQAAAELLGLRERFAPRLRITSDDVSLDLRGIGHALARDVAEVTGIDELVATMADPSVKTIWHS